MTDETEKPENDFQEDTGEKLRTVLLSPTGDGGIKSPDLSNRRPASRPAAPLDTGFNALLIANQATYRLNNVVDAIRNVCRQNPSAVPFFEEALSLYVTGDVDDADTAEG